MSTRIEFRCSKEERAKVEKEANKEGLSTKDYFLNHTIYSRKRKRRIKTEERACVCRIRTCLNMISEGINEKENTKKILEECRSLCQSLK